MGCSSNDWKKKEWEKHLTPEKKSILEDLSDKEKQAEINNHVREKNKKLNKEWKEKIDKIDKTLEEAPKTEKDITVYVPITSTNDLKKGKEILEEGYLVGANDIPGGRDFAEITIPAGESVIYLDNGEFLVRRDTESTITEEPVTTLIDGDPVTKLEMKLLPKALEFNQVEKAEAWGQQTFKEWKESLTEKEGTAVKQYSASLYDAINEYLRENKGKLDIHTRLKNSIENLDSALEKAVVPQKVIVYRRITEQQFEKEYNWLRNPDGTINEKNVAELEQQFKGKTFEQHSYMSTSLIQDPNKSFGNRQPILLEIQIPKGTHAAFIGDLSKYPDQLELLINRGYIFQYNKFSIVVPPDIGKKPYLKIEVTLKDSVVKNT